MDKIRKVRGLTAAALLSLAASAANAVPILTDVITVVDESGSMGGEQAWISGMITGLDAGLAAAAGADSFSAQYGLVGFGGSSGTSTAYPSGHRVGHQHDVAGGQFGTPAEFGTAASGLVLNGSTEDGYSGITTALGYTGQANALRNIILVTDEDRDDVGGGETYASMVTALRGSLLNAVLDIDVACGQTTDLLGLDSSGTGYIADGAGGFTTCTGAQITGGSGTSEADYADLAFATGGAAWDLNQLRVGGNTALSFTAAFIDVKVKETIKPPPTGVPAPGTLALLGLGLAGLGFSKRKKARK